MRFFKVILPAFFAAGIRALPTEGTSALESITNIAGVVDMKDCLNLLRPAQGSM
jgi:hypothetical protein